MSSRTGNIVLLGMVVGAILGAVFGYYFGGAILHIRFIGTIFLNALKMVVVPLIVASMIVGVTSLGDIRRLGRTTGKTLLYYLATTGFSVLIGIILVNIVRPGVGIEIFGSTVPDIVADSREKTLVDVIVSLIPDNLFGAAAEGQILPLIIFSLIFGGVLTAIGNQGRTVINFFEGINAAIMKLVILIIYFAPVGIFALIGSIIAENRDSIPQLVSGLGLYSLTVILGLLVHATIILPAILRLFGKKKPLRYFLNMGQSLATAFTTASSSASLPVTMECVKEKNKVDSRAASFVLPLGATINMDGTALYEAVAALFIAQIYGIDLSIGAQIVIFFTATLASIGAAGIPHAGTVTMVFVLSAVGLPLEGIGLIWAIDWFLDRCRTTVNVWGDSIGAAVIGETGEIKSYSVTSRKIQHVAESGKPSGKDYERPKSESARYPKGSRRKDSRRKDSRFDKNRGRSDSRGTSQPRYNADRKSGRSGGMSGPRYGHTEEQKNKAAKMGQINSETKNKKAISGRGDPDPSSSDKVKNGPSSIQETHPLNKNGTAKPPGKEPESSLITRSQALNKDATATASEGHDDDYFDIKFPKLNLFEDDSKGEKAESSQPDAKDTKVDKEKQKEDDQSEAESDIQPDDKAVSWGREKKKRPGR